jgi:hypothetical protein
MKRLLSALSITIILILTAVVSFAQPANDDPCSATALTVSSTCIPEGGTNAGATNSTVPAAACDGGSSDGDVWFSATVPAGGAFTIIVSPGTLTDVGMAVYTGPNCSSLVFNSCVTGGNASYPTMPYKALSGLTPGNLVWIRIWDVNNDQTGTFTICAVTCNLSAGISGSTTGCSAVPEQLCATSSFATYSWTGGATTQCINVTSTGTYIVTVSDNNGCIASASHNYTASASPTVNITGSATACSANNPQLCVPNTFSTVAWSSGDSVLCITPTTGTYTVTVTAANGCTATDSHTITVYTSPSVSVTGPPSKCSNGSEQLCVPSGFNTYSWSSGDLSNCMTPVSSGTYTVTVSDIHGCTATASHSITVHNAPSISVTGPANACPGTGTQLCAPGGYSSYAWSDGSTTSCITPVSSGAYIATVTDPFGCTGSATKNINIWPAPGVTISGPSNACVGSNPQLCANVGFVSYNWSNGGTANCINPSSTGTYTIVVTDNHGCTGQSNQSFTLDTLPVSTITGPTISCNAATIQLCAPAGNSSYQWSNNATTSCISTNTSATYSVTVTGANGCTTSSSHSLTVIPTFAMSVSGPTTACSGTNLQLCATNGSYTYQWSSGETTRCISPVLSGTYTVIATNASGCTRSATKGLTIYSPLNATINGPTSACIGSNVPLCATSGANGYVWNTGATTDCINVNNSGTYSVTLTDGNGCTASITKQVTFSSTFNVNIDGPVSGCNGLASELCVPSGYTSYIWSTGETTPCISVNTAGNYSVTIHDPVGCVANSFYNLPFSAPPTVSISGSSGACIGSFVSWCAPAGFASYQWSNGGTSECVNISQDTAYTVEVTDTNGCYATATRNLQLIIFNPVVLESNNLLICDTFNTGFTYEWLLNGQPTSCNTDTCTPTLSGLYSVIVTDTATGCSETATYNYIINSINIYDVNDISIYPNPFNGNQFFVDLNGRNGNVTVEVFDEIGALIQTQTSYQEKICTVTIPFVKAGIYLVRLKTNSGMIIKRMVATGN